VPTQENFNPILDSLANLGWAVDCDFLKEEIMQGLLHECKELHAKGNFKKAAVGKGSQQQVINEVRGDAILWFDEQNLSHFQRLFYDKINRLKQSINQDFFLGLKEFECHFAIYPAGSFYKKHSDRFHNTDNRQISCILYLNKDWQEAYGGQLRLYTETEGQESYYDIKPQWATFACFRSELPHEVLPTTRERYSITGWLKN